MFLHVFYTRSYLKAKHASMLAYRLPRVVHTASASCHRLLFLNVSVH